MELTDQHKILIKPSSYVYSDDLVIRELNGGKIWLNVGYVREHPEKNQITLFKRYSAPGGPKTEPGGILYFFGEGFGTLNLGLSYQLNEEIAENGDDLSSMVGLTWPKWNAIKQELIAWYEVLKEIPLETTTVV